MSQDPSTAPVPEYGAPPVAKPKNELSEPPQMGPFARIANIFFSPGEVFEDVRRSPRDWWLPLILLLAILSASGYVLQARLDLTPERLAAATVDLGLEQQNKTRKDLTEQERTAVAQQEQVTEMFFRYGVVAGLVFLTIMFFVIAAVYFVLTMIVQAKTTFFRVLAVVAYAYFVPNVLKAVLQVIFSFITSADDVDPVAYIQQGGLLSASPAALVSFRESPALWTLLSYFDVFTIWFLILVAIGLSIIPVKKMKMSTAVMVTVIPYVLVMLVGTGFAMLRG